MSKELKKDWLPKLQVRYARRSREGKSRMLDELCEDYEYERKYAIKLLRGGLPVPAGRAHPGPERQYEVVEPVVRQGSWLTAEQPLRQASGARPAAMAALLRRALRPVEWPAEELDPARQPGHGGSVAGASPGSIFGPRPVWNQTGKFVAVGDSDTHRHLGSEPARIFGS